MRVIQILLVTLCLVNSITHTQNVESYDFKPVQELKRHLVLQDPYLKSDAIGGTGRKPHFDFYSEFVLPQKVKTIIFRDSTRKLLKYNQI